jgi:hypothetical protein
MTRSSPAGSRKKNLVTTGHHGQLSLVKIKHSFAEKVDLLPQGNVCIWHSKSLMFSVDVKL